MIVVKGKNGGFCFGVKRAVDVALSLKGERNFILGEIIHNEFVNEQLKKSGLTVINSIDDDRLQKGDTLLIRTHGEPFLTYEKAREKGLNVVDCTCPFVSDIQKIVEKHYRDGYTIVIIGKAGHPEIIGINGWCENKAIITESADDLNKIQSDKVCIVVQTTYSKEKFKKIINNFTYSKAKTVDIFTTICYTTTRRQQEADIISRDCEAVIVIGGANSNNTDKLFEICKNNCANVFRIVDPVAFNYEKIKSFNKVGIVMGASTPIEQFQEVVSNMEKITEEITTTETVESEVKQEEVKEAVSAKSEMEIAFNKIKPSKDLKIGQVVSAYISSAKDEGLTLSMKNTKKDFELPKDEVMGEYNKEEYLSKIGEEIRVMVVAKNPLKLSEKAMAKVLEEEADLEEIKNGKIFETEITATNKGGLIGKYGSYSVFVPASQIKLGFVKDLEKYVGKTLRLKAEKVESRGARRQIVGSQKVILEAEKAERDAIIVQKE